MLENGVGQYGSSIRILKTDRCTVDVYLVTTSWACISTPIAVSVDNN